MIAMILLQNSRLYENKNNANKIYPITQSDNQK